MISSLFLLGIIAGAAVALPYGPVGFVIIRRFYLFGIPSGMFSALGTATSDTFYAIVVGFGLHRIQKFLLSIAPYTEIGAGLVLIYLGYSAMRTKLKLDDGEIENHPVQDVSSTFLINFLNPTMIFAFALVFSILGNIVHGAKLDFSETFAFVIGVPIGACLLWWAIGALIHHLRKNDRHSVVQNINYYTGLVLLILGIVVLGSSVVRHLL